MYLRLAGMGGNTRGLRVPWKYIRDKLAERWHIPPWLVDESPIGEIELALAMMQIEAACQPRSG